MVEPGETTPRMDLAIQDIESLVEELRSYRSIKANGKEVMQL